MTASLSKTCKDAYQRDGYLCPIGVLSNGEARALRDEFERLERKYASGLPHGFDQYARVNSHLVMDMSRRIARSPAILDAVESILGPDILLWSAEYFVKEARSPKVVSWHQDIKYWGMGETDDEVTAWLALSPATAASGCMKFVPGSHKSALVDHADTFADDNLLSRGQEIAVDVDEADAISAELQPGEMSLHHGRLFHASDPNTTDDRRIGFVMRFIRPDTPVTGEAEDYAMLMRGSGGDGSRVLVTPPEGDFPDAALALYDQVRRAQAETLTDGAAKAVASYAQA